MVGPKIHAAQGPRAKRNSCSREHSSHGYIHNPCYLLPSYHLCSRQLHEEVITKPELSFINKMISPCICVDVSLYSFPLLACRKRVPSQTVSGLGRFVSESVLHAPEQYAEYLLWYLLAPQTSIILNYFTSHLYGNYNRFHLYMHNIGVFYKKQYLMTVCAKLYLSMGDAFSALYNTPSVPISLLPFVYKFVLI